jgi:hypothetical protein
MIPAVIATRERRASLEKEQGRDGERRQPMGDAGAGAVTRKQARRAYDGDKRRDKPFTLEPSYAEKPVHGPGSSRQF